MAAPADEPRRRDALSLGVGAGLDDEESAQRGEGKARIGLPLPDRSELVLQGEAAELVEHQEVGPVGIVAAANERDIALARLDTGERDADRIDAGGFFAHEGARRAGDAVHD